MSDKSDFRRRTSGGRRRFLKLTGASLSVGTTGLTGCLGTGSNGGSSFPENDIRLVIPYSPGGGFDTYSRLTAPYLEEYLPNDVNVNLQNMGGAGGIIGHEEIYNADPDGHTIGMIFVQGMVREQLTADVRFDIPDYDYLALVRAGITGLAVDASIDVNTFDDYVAAVENNELKFGSSGLGSDSTIVPTTMGAISGLYPPDNVIDNVVIYDEGTNEVAAGIARGEVQVHASGYSSLIPFIDNGDYQAIIELSMGDEPQVGSDVDTLQTADVPNGTEVADVNTTGGAFAGPPGIPEDRFEILEEAFNQAINDEDFRADAEEAQRPVTYGDGTRAKEMAQNAHEQWSELSDLLEQIRSAE